LRDLGVAFLQRKKLNHQRCIADLAIVTNSQY